MPKRTSCRERLCRHRVVEEDNIANSTASHSDSLARGTEQFAEDLKHKWQDIEHAVSVKGKEMRTLSRDYINHAPFKSVLAASAAGLVLGYLISKFRN